MFASKLGELAELPVLLRVYLKIIELGGLCDSTN